MRVTVSELSHLCMCVWRSEVGFGEACFILWPFTLIFETLYLTEPSSHHLTILSGD